MNKRTHSWRHVHQRGKRSAIQDRRGPATESFNADLGEVSLEGSQQAAGGSRASIPGDVDDAVEAQLVKQNRPAPHDPDKVMEDDYGFDPESMDGFLTAVKKRLAARGHRFSYDNPFVNTALKAKLFDLKVKIQGKTK
jgi:hypothetical protein